MSTQLSTLDLHALIATARPWEVAEIARLVEQRESLRIVSDMEQDLSLFFREAWKFYNPGRELTWSWHYDLLCEHLMQVRQRKCRRLIINVPPRTAKSTLGVMSFPCWVWTTDPKHEFLCGSHSLALSTDHSVARRNLLMSDWYRALWGNRFSLSADRNLTTQFDNDKRGRMIATSTGSGAEGKGGDTAILDDPMSSEMSLSDVERLSANRWVNHTLKQRLNNPATASIIIIMQRLHELDTTGFVTEEEKGLWKKIEIPLIAEKDERWEFPISKRVVTRKKGDVLQPDRFPPEIVEEKKRNRLVFSGQYQQRPAPLEGNLIKRADVMYYGGRDPLTGALDEALPDAKHGEFFDRVIVSVDCSFKDLKTSDYVAMGAIGTRGRKRFVLEVINEHLDVTGTELAIRRMKEKWQATAVIVEDKANGPAVISKLQQDLTGIIAIEPQGGKIARMFAAAPVWQAHDWYVDRTAAWTEPFIAQITQFPTAAFDDMVDMMTQAAIYLGAGIAALEMWAKLGQ